MRPAGQLRGPPRRDHPSAGRAALLLGLLVAGGLARGALPGSRPATGPARPTTQPARPGAAPERIRTLVARLSSDRYQERLAARRELRTLVILPGVAERLRASLRTAADAEARAALESIVDEYDQPLVMVWCRAQATAVGRSFSRTTLFPGAPWLFIRGDGGFVYDAESPLFTGRASDPSRGEWRTGKLDTTQLWALKRTLEESSLEKAPNQIVPYRIFPGSTGVEVALYPRFGGEWKTFLIFLDDKALRGDTDSGETAKPEVKLLLALSRRIAAVRSKPYEGPWCVYAVTRPFMEKEADKVPLWPVGALDVTDAMVPGGRPVPETDLEAVRAALAKRDIYKFSQRRACRVRLFPYLKEARELYYGRGR